jgi:hypothetical protein
MTEPITLPLPLSVPQLHQVSKLYQALATHSDAEIEQAMLVFVANDTMPRVTTVLSLHAQAEIEKAAEYANKYGKLTDRAKARYGLIDIVSTCTTRTIAEREQVKAVTA